MRYYFLLLMLLFSSDLTYSALAEKYEAKWGPRKDVPNPVVPKTYKINLDLSPKEAFAEVFHDNKEHIKEIFGYVRNYFPPVFYLIRKMPRSWVESYSPKFAEEIAAFAELSDLTFGEVFFWNLAYELTTACSSIIYQDNYSRIFHAYNMDFTRKLMLFKLVYYADYYKEGKLLFRANLILGVSGFLSGEQPGKFAISINQRVDRHINTNYQFHPISTAWGIIKGLWNVLYHKEQLIQWVMRESLENDNSYEEAYERLTTSKVPAPVYYIISGVSNNQGSIIRKEREGTFVSDSLNTERGVWFIVATNYDLDLEEPKDDTRRAFEIDKMNEIGRDQISPTRIYEEIMSKYPTFNAETIWTSIMNAKEDYFNTTVWG